MKLAASCALAIASFIAGAIAVALHNYQQSDPWR